MVAQKNGVPGLGQELVPAGEKEGIAKIVEIHLGVTDPNEKPFVPRGQHMKGHGLLKAKFEVLPDLPSALQKGIFAKPHVYDAYIRFSNGKGRDDRSGDAHGMAIKLVGVPGEKVLEEQKDATTQDIILFDNPVFFIKDVADYVPFMGDFRNLKAAGLTFGKITSGLKLLFSRNYMWRLLRATGSKKPDSLLRTTFWSTVPYKLGDAAVKYRAVPDLAGAPPVHSVDSPDKFRLAAVAHLKDHEARFDFFVQVQTDPAAMPVEDPTVEWTSPFQKVATIRIPPQEFNTPERDKFGENLSFTPWHSLPEHRPLGGINRARKEIYRAISKQRHELNGVPMTEPTE